MESVDLYSHLIQQKIFGMSFACGCDLCLLCADFFLIKALVICILFSDKRNDHWVKTMQTTMKIMDRKFIHTLDTHGRTFSTSTFNICTYSHLLSLLFRRRLIVYLIHFWGQVVFNCWLNDSLWWLVHVNFMQPLIWIFRKVRNIHGKRK